MGGAAKHLPGGNRAKLPGLSRARTAELVPNKLTSHAIWESANNPHSLLGAGVASTGIGAWVQSADRRGAREGFSQSDQMKEILTGGYTFNKDLEAKRSKRAAEEQRHNEELRQAQTDRDIADIDRAYGVGNDAGAQYNNRQLNNFYANYEGDVLSGENAANDQNLEDSAIRNRQELAAKGQLGSSVDYDNQRQNLSNYIAGRQSAIQRARAAGQGLQQQDNQRRLELDSAAAGDTSLNPSWTSSYPQQAYAISSARRNLVPSAIGSGLTQAGQLYQQNAVAQGQGYQGLGGAFSLGPSKTSSSGSYS